jgi:hypothetical protein
MQRTKFTSVLMYCVLFSVSQISFASNGGGIVKNGGGSVEQEIFFSYRTLPKAIDNCLSFTQRCGVNAQEIALLKSIRKIVIENPASNTRIIFVSERENPGFFTTSSTEPHRIAMTGLTPDSSIYFNSDLFYENGVPTQSFSSLTALWIHEIGHQTGAVDHNMLATLGSKVRDMMEDIITRTVYPRERLNLVLTTINYKGTVGSGRADIYLNDGTENKSYTKYVYEATQCPDGQIPMGWQLGNMHWDNSSSRDPAAADTVMLGFNAWLDVQCIDLRKSPSPITTVQRVLRLNFVFDVAGDKARCIGVK